MITEFSSWWARHSEVHPYVSPIKGTRRWVVINCECEKVTKLNGSTKTIFYNAIMCVDPKSKYAGNIYNDDSSLELYIKFTGLAFFVRPIHTFIYTFYHLSGLGMAKAVREGLIKQQSIHEIAIKILRSFSDIFRGLYYGSLLEFTSLTACIVGPFKKSMFFDCRAFTGYLLTKMYRGKRTELNGSPCMLRHFNIMQTEKREQRLSDKVNYKNPSNKVLVSLENLARKPY